MQPNSLFQETERLLQSGLEAIELSVDDKQFSQLAEYLALLSKWSKTYNLTAIKAPMELVSFHILDSLSLSPHLVGQRFIDVGTGAGLPGIPLAILNPDKHFSLLDSNGKKIRFLFHVRSQLKLTNTSEIQSRAETFIPSHRFDAVITRAFADLPAMLQNCHHLVVENGLFLAMKGKFPQREIDHMPAGYRVLDTERLRIPGVGVDRHLIKIVGSKIGDA